MSAFVWFLSGATFALLVLAALAGWVMWREEPPRNYRDEADQ
jgi:hypothetical protein